jgi:hypothetical protein
MTISAVVLGADGIVVEGSPEALGLLGLTLGELLTLPGEWPVARRRVARRPWRDDARER